MDGEISLKEISHQRIFLPAVTAAAVTVALVTLVVLLRRKRGRRPSPVVATETAAGARDARSQMVGLCCVATICRQLAIWKLFMGSPRARALRIGVGDGSTAIFASSFVQHIC